MWNFLSREEELSYEEIQGIFKQVSNQIKKKTLCQVERLSIDEISKRKGYRDLITLVSNVDTGNLLEVIDSHKQEEIIEVLKQQSMEVRMQVREVSVDMWAGFAKVIAEVFPNAAVVFDRFHVMKLVNEALNKLRKQAGVNTRLKSIFTSEKLVGANGDRERATSTNLKPVSFFENWS